MSLFPNVPTGDILISTQPAPPSSCPHHSLQLLDEVTQQTSLCTYTAQKPTHTDTTNPPAQDDTELSPLTCSCLYHRGHCGDEQECEVTTSSVSTVQQQALYVLQPFTRNKRTALKQGTQTLRQTKEHNFINNSVQEDVIN